MYLLTYLTSHEGMGDGGSGHWLVRMERRPAGWSVCLPLLIFPCTIKSRSSLLAPAHPGGPGKKGRKTVVVVTYLLICARILRYLNPDLPRWLSMYLCSSFTSSSSTAFSLSSRARSCSSSLYDSRIRSVTPPSLLSNRQNSK